MQPKIGSPSRQTLLRLIGTVLAVLLLVYLLSRQGWSEILTAVRELPPGNFFLALALIVASRLVVPARWHVLLRSAGVDIPYGQTLRITLAGLFASNFLPTTIGGDIVRLAGALQLNADRAVTGSSIVVDRLVGMAGMATALPFGVQPLWSWLNSGLAGAAVQGSISMAGLGTAAWNLGVKTTRRVLEALKIWLKQPQALLLSWGFSWVHMLVKFAAIWLLFSGMNDPVPFWRITGLWSFTYFVTLFPISINGLGLQELSMTFIFANLGGAAMSVVLPAALLVRFLEMVASLPGALYLPGILSGIEKQGELPGSDPAATGTDR